MSQGVARTSGGYFAEADRHTAARHYGAADGDVPHECEFCSADPEPIAPVPSGRHSAGVRRWGAQEAAWKPES